MSMKPEQIYEHLMDVAAKLNIKVKEKNLDTLGLHAKSGFCKIKGEQIFIMDKKKSIHKKNDLLASCLGNIQHDHIYIIPAIRELLHTYKDSL
jgi:hypothetical protein